MDRSQPGRRPSLVWLAVGTVALLVLAFLGYGLFSPAAALQVGSEAPDFKLVTLDGDLVSLGAQRGNVVVVNFFASWCTPCWEEAADLEMAWRTYQGQGVRFVGIAYKDVEAKTRAFVTEFDVTYPSAVEPSNRTARTYGVTGVPETFVVDQQGRLVKHFIGPVSQGELSQVIDSLLGR